MRGLSTLVLSAVLGGGLVIGAAPASALKIENLSVSQDHGDPDQPEIHVKFDPQADDWTIVTSDSVKFKFGFWMVVKSAYAIDNQSGVKFHLDNFPMAYVQVHSTDPSLQFGEPISGSADMVKPGNKTNELKKNALEVCKKIRSNGGKPNKDHVIQRNIKGSAVVLVGTLSPIAQQERKVLDLWASYRIVCEHHPGWTKPTSVAGLTAGQKGKLKVQSVDLFLATFQGQETDPNPGTSCKKLKVTVRIETNQAGPVSYTLWRQPGEAVTRQKMSEFQTNGQFKGRYIVEDVFVHTFDKTTYVQYMAEVAGSPFGPSTQWKPITIHCGGGLTTGQQQGGGDIVPSFKVTKTELKIISIAGTGCPTKAFVTATFFANKPGTFKYLIGTSFGPNQHGIAQAKKVGNVYRVQETLTVDVTKSGTLRAHAIANDFPQSEGKASKAFNCAGLDPVQGVTQ